MFKLAFGLSLECDDDILYWKNMFYELKVRKKAPSAFSSTISMFFPRLPSGCCLALVGGEERGLVAVFGFIIRMHHAYVASFFHR